MALPALLAIGAAIAAVAAYTPGVSAVPKPRSKKPPKSVEGFVHVSGSGTPAPDARARLAAFRKKYPPRNLKPGERGIVESLKADRDRR